MYTSERERENCGIFVERWRVACWLNQCIDSSLDITSGAYIICLWEWNKFDVMSSWHTSITSFVAKSVLGKLALMRMRVNWKRCSCDHNLKWRILKNVGLTMAYHCRKLNAYCLLSCQDDSTLTFPPAKPLWPCIMVKVIDTTMSIYTMHSLNTVRDMAIIVQVTHLSSWKLRYDLEWRARSSDWEKIM